MTAIQLDRSKLLGVRIVSPETPADSANSGLSAKIGQKPDDGPAGQTGLAAKAGGGSALDAKVGLKN